MSMTHISTHLPISHVRLGAEDLQEGMLMGGWHEGSLNQQGILQLQQAFTFTSMFTISWNEQTILPLHWLVILFLSLRSTSLRW